MKKVVVVIFTLVLTVCAQKKTSLSSLDRIKIIMSVNGQNAIESLQLSMAADDLCNSLKSPDAKQKELCDEIRRRQAKISERQKWLNDVLEKTK